MKCKGCNSELNGRSCPQCGAEISRLAAILGGRRNRIFIAVMLFFAMVAVTGLTSPPPTPRPLTAQEKAEVYRQAAVDRAADEAKAQERQNRR